MPTIRVRYFAGARAAAGLAQEQVVLSDEACSVADLVRVLRHHRGPDLSRVLPACSFLLNGVAVHDDSTVFADQDELDVLPPFAGG